MRSVSCDRIEGAAITEALRAAYTGYFIPLAFTEAATENYLRVHDIALDASPVWRKDGRPVAIALLGVREDRAWVGAFGIAPEFRGKGLAQAMFGEVVRRAKRKKVHSMTLEVLEENARARAIYERAGFFYDRKLFSLQSAVISSNEAQAQPLEIRAAIAKEDSGAPPPCWQRAARTLELRARQLAALQSDRSVAVYRYDGAEASLWKATLDEGGDAVLAGIARSTGARKLTISNEPEGSPLLSELYGRAWSPTAVQYEMRLTL